MSITIGAAYPWIASYSASSGTVTYSNPAKLARLVDVTIAPEGGDAVEFYADNALAESYKQFAKGTLTLNVDGLDLADAAKILGYTAEEGVYVDYADATVPYVGFGVVKKLMMNGTISYLGIVLHKVQFQMPEEAGTTQGDTVDFQTQTLTASILKDDATTPKWRSRKVFSSESDAETWVKTQLGYVAPTGGNGG